MEHGVCGYFRVDEGCPGPSIPGSTVSCCGMLTEFGAKNCVFHAWLVSLPSDAVERGAPSSTEVGRVLLQQSIATDQRLRALLGRCPHCGSSDLQPVRQEIGKKGELGYSWIEYLECRTCRRTMVQASDKGELK